MYSTRVFELCFNLKLNVSFYVDPSVSLHSSSFNNLNLVTAKPVQSVTPDEMISLYKESITLYSKVTANSTLLTVPHYKYM